MIPWEKVATSTVPGGRENLRLMRRGSEYSILLGRAELMNSRLSGSEEALASLACERLRGSAKPRRVLIGGLGMGFTLRAALAALRPDDEVVVAEIVPAVVSWARGPMEDLFGTSMSDPRVTVHLGDVGALIRRSPAGFDAILLDVDNGPDGMVRSANDGLYGGSGLAASKAALRKGGILAIWSAAPDDRFVRTLGHVGFSVEEKKVHASRSGKGPRHVIWLAKPLAGGSAGR